MWGTVMISALLLGAVSSTHCIGMCGPLALAIPLQRFEQRVDKVMALLLYNGGRITSYVAIGLLVGLLGRGVLTPVWQQGFAIVSGTGIVLFSMLRLLGRGRYRLPLPGFITAPLFKWMAYWMHRRKIVTLFLLGIGNGALPCGLVYMAAMMALSMGSIDKSLVFMAFYGIGTAPAMMLLSLSGLTVSVSLRSTFKRITPLLAFVAGILIMLRGFNIHIPFVSNWLPEQKPMVECQPLN